MASRDAKDLCTVIDDSLATLSGVGAPATWVPHNHDVMRHTSRYARTTVARWVPNQRYRREGGIDLELGTRRARAAARGRPPRPHLVTLRPYRPWPRRLARPHPLARTERPLRLQPRRRLR
ncbi:hypothetical protein [Streptomyces brasiliscabiei]|uniref:hypothetical protein n=1 Tax=Streptomyces brasiliscabiei TaxID=2736302 RepID=UPI001F1C2E06|nr:hypothetical protein [Streptomyces brasiliscabiei]